MIMDRLIIIWITFAFAVVSSVSLDLKGDDGAVCNVTVYERNTRNVTERRLYAIKQRTLWSMSLKSETSDVLLVKQTCCDGYENKSSNCVPQCSPKCERGYCAKPNDCLCKSGWGGKFCNESLFCFVDANLTTKLSMLPVEAGTEIATGNTLKKFGRPACLPKCRNQTSNFPVTNRAGERFHLLPVETPCNIEAIPWKTYKYLLAGSLGIVSLAVIVVCTVFVVRRKRKPIDAMDGNGSRRYIVPDRPQVVPDGRIFIPGSGPVTDFVHLDTRSETATTLWPTVATPVLDEPAEYEYDDLPKEPASYEYDYVRKGPAEYEYDYVYNHRP